MIDCHTCPGQHEEGWRHDKNGKLEPPLVCTRCGQKMEHKEQAEGCEDPFCPLT